MAARPGIEKALSGNYAKPGNRTAQNCNCNTTCLQSRKTSKTCLTPLQKQGQTQKGGSSIDPTSRMDILVLAIQQRRVDSSSVSTVGAVLRNFKLKG